MSGHGVRKTPGGRRVSFRTRLTLLIAGVFVLGGAAVIGVQFLLVQQFLGDQVDAAGDLTTARLTAFRLDQAGIVVTDWGTAVRLPADDADDGPQENPLVEIPPGSSIAHSWACPDHSTPQVTATDEERVVECVDDEGRTVGEPLSIHADTETIDLDYLDGLIRDAAVFTSLRVSDGVQHSLLLWSAAVLAGFALIAVLAASWLSRRSLDRVADITTTMHAITAEGLDRRLALAGPRDEIRELGDAIDSTLDRLEAAFERQDRFIAGASHELRTPLTINRTLLEIPLAQGRFPADLEPAVRAALEANERSSQLVSALLTLTRARSAPSSDTSTDLRELTATLLQERADAAAERGLEVSGEGLHADGADDDAAAHGLTVGGEGLETGGADDGAAGTAAAAAVGADLALLAVANLLDNAVRHNADGGRLAVEVGRDEAAGTVWVDVVNDGADLTATDVEALKEPFHRGASSRLSGDGMGLGLTLVDMVATAAGGALTLAARPEGGLRVRLTLPAAPAPAAEAEAVATRQASPAS